jgi:hypothetical protein
VVLLEVKQASSAQLYEITTHSAVCMQSCCLHAIKEQPNGMKLPKINLLQLYAWEEAAARNSRPLQIERLAD